MTTMTHRERTVQATVQLGTGGQGVLVPGHLIVTAAHCIPEFTTNGAMAHEDLTVIGVTTPDGTTFLASVLACEPCADVAVLGLADGQSFPEDEERFEAFCEQTQPVPLYTDDLPPDLAARPSIVSEDRWRRFGHSVKIPAAVLTHNKGWVAARVQQLRPSHTTLWIEPAVTLDGGTSGGPVIAEDGRLLGVVTWGSKDGTPISRLHRTLPVWAVERMLM